MANSGKFSEELCVQEVNISLYLSCVKNGDDKTQRDIDEAANVTEVTIRNRYKGLKELLNL